MISRIVIERQERWSKLVTSYLFLAGAEGGAGVVLSSLALVGIWEVLLEPGLITGMILLIIGLICLVLDAGSPDRIPRVFLNKTSWIARGTWFISAFIILGLIRIAVAEFALLPGININLLWIYIDLSLSVLIILYRAFLLLDSRKGIPFWGNPGTFLLMIFPTVLMGLGILGMMALVYEQPLIWSFPATVLVFVLIEALLIYGLLASSLVGPEASKASARYMLYQLRGPFLGGVIGLGIVVVALINVHALTLGVSSIHVLSSGILILIGGYLLNYSIIKSGHYISHVPVP